MGSLAESDGLECPELECAGASQVIAQYYQLIRLGFEV